MCTLTIFPVSNTDFILTSNRDESPARETELPEIHEYKSKRVVFPKDRRGGGSWIGMSGMQRVVCVLNGAFKAHERKPNYRMSRGVILKEFLITEQLDDDLNVFDFNDIEPFTMVVIDWLNSLRILELIWDGNTRHITEKALEPAIWSSSSLYDQKMKAERQKWFEAFFDMEPTVTQINAFHNGAACETNMDYGIIMDRQFVKTTSITQICKKGDTLLMRYRDLLRGEEKELEINTSTAHAE